MCVCVCVYVCIYMCLCVYIYVCVCVYMCVCVYIYMCVCVYMCVYIHIKYINNKDSLHSSGNYIPYLITTYSEKECESEYVCMCVY